MAAKKRTAAKRSITMASTRFTARRDMLRELSSAKLQQRLARKKK